MEHHQNHYVPLGHKPAFDGLRAFAVLLVAGVHSRPRIIPGGSVGVDIFFVLSGFLITTLLMEERDRNGHIAYRKFYARRALRLIPALAAILTAVSAYALLVATPQMRTSALREVVAAGSYTRTLNIWKGTDGTLLGHTWSLALEEQFYLLMPVVLAAGIRKGKTATKTIIGLGICATIIATSRNIGLEGPGMLWLQRPEALLLGSAAALVRRDHQQLIKATATRYATQITTTTVAGLAAVAMWNGADDKHSIGFTIAAALSVALILCLAENETSPIATAFSNNKATWFGRRAYGFYLWHMPILRLGDDHLHGINTPARIGISLAAALAATIISYEIIERPALKLKTRFQAPDRKPTTNNQ